MAGKLTYFRTICADLKIGLRFSFLGAIFGVTLGFCFDNFSDLLISINNPLVYTEGSVICVMYYFFNSFSFGGVFSTYFATIMATIPYSTSYCQEVEGGMSVYKIARCGTKNYARSKFLVASLLGGLTILGGSLIFILALGTYLPTVTPAKIYESYGIPFYSALTAGSGTAYFIIVLYITFLGGALWASVGLCASAYFPSIYVAISAPFIFRFVLTQVGRLLKLPNGLRLELLLSARGIIYSDSVTLVTTTSIVVLFILICYRLFSKRIERSIRNVE